MFFDLSIGDPAERLKAAWQLHSQTPRNQNGFGGNIYKFISPVSAWKATPGTARATFALHVDQCLCNPMNNLHGGAAATIFDVVTSYAIGVFSKDGFWEFPGVSRNLSCTYLRPVPEGSDVLIDCEVVQIGKRICTIRAEIRGGVDGKGEILVTGEHTKANIDPPKV